MPLPYVAPTEDWSELDALVGAELDIMLARSSSPVTEPEAEEAAFLAQAGAYLGRHPDPQRVINEMASRLPATAPNEPVEPETPEEADDEPA
jgi:hypothetical protein